MRFRLVRVFRSSTPSDGFDLLFLGEDVALQVLVVYLLLHYIRLRCTLLARGRISLIFAQVLGFEHSTSVLRGIFLHQLQ